MLNPDYCYIVTTQAKKKDVSLEEKHSTFVRVASRFGVTAVALRFNAPLISEVATTSPNLSLPYGDWTWPW